MSDMRGKHDEQEEYCTVCGGKGEVSGQVVDRKTGQVKSHKHQCLSCGGRGKKRR